MADTPTKRLELSPSDLAKVMAARSKHEKRVKVNEEWLFLAEFGVFYSWQGVMAVKNNEITFQEAEMMLLAARKVWDGRVYDHASASFIGAVSASTKKPSLTFRKATKDLVKRTRADK